MKNLEYIEEYLSGRMDEGARTEFERRLQVDEALKEEYEFVAATVKSVRSVHLKEKLAMLQTLEKKRSSYMWIWTAIGILLLVGLAVWFLKPEKKTDLMVYVEEHVDDFVVHSTLRSGGTSLSDRQEEAYGLFILEDFKVAAPLLEKLWNEERDTVAYLYYNISLLGLGEKQVGEVLEAPALQKYRELLDTLPINQ